MVWNVHKIRLHDHYRIWWIFFKSFWKKICPMFSVTGSWFSHRTYPSDVSRWNHLWRFYCCIINAGFCQHTSQRHFRGQRQVHRDSSAFIVKHFWSLLITWLRQQWLSHRRNTRKDKDSALLHLFLSLRDQTERGWREGGRDTEKGGRRERDMYTERDTYIHTEREREIL